MSDFLIFSKTTVFKIFLLNFFVAKSLFQNLLFLEHMMFHFLSFIISLYSPTFSIFLLILAELIFLAIFDNAWVDLIFIFCSWGWKNARARPHLDEAYIFVTVHECIKFRPYVECFCENPELNVAGGERKNRNVQV